MIIRDIKKLPRHVKWAGSTAHEVELAGDRMYNLEETSACMWQIEQNGEIICVAGIQRLTFIGDVFLWFMLCEGFMKNLRGNIRESKALMKELSRRYRSVTTAVDMDDPTAKRFAEWLGWKSMNNIFDLEGRTYCRYEVGV